MAFVLCLDTLGRGSSLHLHVSKPPKEGTLQHTFLKELEQVKGELGTLWEEVWGSCLLPQPGLAEFLFPLSSRKLENKWREAGLFTASML